MTDKLIRDICAEPVSGETLRNIRRSLGIAFPLAPEGMGFEEQVKWATKALFPNAVTKEAYAARLSALNRIHPDCWGLSVTERAAHAPLHWNPATKKFFFQERDL